MTWDFDRHVAVFNRAVSSGEWDPVVDLFAGDATLEFVGPGVPPIVGREAIAAAYATDGPDDTIELVGPPTREGDEDVVPYRWQSSARTGTMRARAPRQPPRPPGRDLRLSLSPRRAGW